MSYGPAGFEDDWDEDEFDFGEHYDSDYQAQNDTFTQENFKKHVNDKSSPLTSKPQKANGGLGLHTNPTMTSNISLGRGRGRGGFSIPKTRSNTSRKNANSTKRNRGQDNLLFTRTSNRT